MQLTFDAFDQSISYCPVIYSARITTNDGTEITWNRENNPLEHDPAYETVPDSAISANEPSDHYLTISRPENGNRGIVTIEDTGSLELLTGDYNLEIRAYHQGIKATKTLSNRIVSCDLTITAQFDTNAA